MHLIKPDRIDSIKYKIVSILYLTNALVIHLIRSDAK